MASMSEMTNAAFKINVAGKQYSVQRLSVSELIGVMEERVNADRMKELERVAGLLLNGPERVDFFAKALASSPSAEEMQAAAFGKMATLDGLSVLLRLAVEKAAPMQLQHDVPDAMDVVSMGKEAVGKLVEQLTGIKPKAGGAAGSPLAGTPEPS